MRLSHFHLVLYNLFVAKRVIAVTIVQCEWAFTDCDFALQRIDVGIAGSKMRPEFIFELFPFVTLTEDCLILTSP